MSKSNPTEAEIRKQAIGLLDNRSTDNDGMLIKRDKKVTMLDIFGTEQKTAVAYYVSDLLAKGFNNQQIVVAVKDKYGLNWNIQKVNIVKALLHKLWRAEMAHSMNDQIAREISTIDTQLRETWEAWEFSKKGIKHTKKRTENSNSEAPEMKYNLEEIINEENVTAGDIKFLQHINDLGKEKRKLLGLYAPEKKDNGGPQTAVQFNIVGEGAGGEITDLMETIMRGAPKVAQKPQNAQIEDVQVVEDNSTQGTTGSDTDIDKLIEDILAE